MTPGALKEYQAIEGLPPKGSFDPAGAWRQTWRIWLLRRNPKDVNYRGFIRLRREPSADGRAFVLTVNQTTVHVSHACIHETKARIRCANDELASPRSWNIETRLFSPRDNREFSNAAVKKSSSVKDGKIQTERAGGVFVQNAPAAITSSWSILEALQRLPGPDMTPLDFAFLDELDKLKPGHRLSHREETTIPFGEEVIQVHCYQQIGQGLLPWLYYVGSDHRLLLAISGLRAYILDAHVNRQHEEVLERLSGKGRRS